MTCEDFTFSGPVFDGTFGDNKFSITPIFSDYTDDVYPPNTYFIEITGTVTGSTTTATSEAELELLDPCDSPTITVSAVP